MRKVVLCLAALLLLAAPVFADYATGFEAVEGYTNDLISNQIATTGWLSSEDAMATTSKYIWVGDPTYNIAVGGGTQTGPTTPTTAGYTGGPLAPAYEGQWALNIKSAPGRGVWHWIGGSYNKMRVDVRMQFNGLVSATTPDNSYFWLALQNSAATSPSSDRTAGFGFKGNNIVYYSNNGGYYSTGITWTPSTWYHFVAEVDVTTHTYDLWVNDSLVANDVSTWHTTANPSDTVYFYRNGPVGNVMYASIDSLSVTQIVPEPSSIFTLAAGAVGMLGFIRRKK